MRRVTVECIQAGQPRPYADSIYEYKVTFEQVKQYGPNKGEIVLVENPSLEDCIAAVRLLGRPFKTKDEKPDWHETRLERVDRDGPGKFRVKLIQESTN